MGWERSGREGGWERDNGENSAGKNRGWVYIKQLHLKYTCQGAVIVKAAPAVLCTLPDPRPVKYAMLDQKGVLLCPTPDPRSVKAPPSQITGPQITCVERLCQRWFTLWMLFVAFTRFLNLSKDPGPSGNWLWLVGYMKFDIKHFVPAKRSKSSSQ